MKMVRKQVYITAEQDQKLEELSAERGITESEVIRVALDAMSADSDAKKQQRLEAWARLEALIDERARGLPKSDGGRTWTRDELYERHPGS